MRNMRARGTRPSKVKKVRRVRVEIQYEMIPQKICDLMLDGKIIMTKI